MTHLKESADLQRDSRIEFVPLGIIVKSRAKHTGIDQTAQLKMVHIQIRQYLSHCVTSHHLSQPVFENPIDRSSHRYRGHANANCVQQRLH